MEKEIKLIKKFYLYQCLLIGLMLSMFFLSVTAFSQDEDCTLIEFIPGTTAKAGEVNDNFNCLASRLCYKDEDVNWDCNLHMMATSIWLYGNTNTDAYLFLEPEGTESGFFDIGAFDTVLGFIDPQAKLRIDAETIVLQTRGSGGNVGIGTVEPKAKLHIGKDMGCTLRDWMDKGIIVCDDSDGGYFGVKDEGTNHKDTVIVWGDDTEDSLRFIFNACDDTEKEIMRLIPSGNVGIGTTEPNSTLQIGNSIFSGKYGLYSNARAGLIVGEGAGELPHVVGLQIATDYNDSTHPNYGLVLVNGEDTTNYDVWGIQHDGPIKENGGLYFTYLEGKGEGSAGNIHFGTTHMFISKKGNVGIGTTSPKGTLDVNGSIYQRGSELHADYVFEQEYKLESIEAHSKYMWDNKHLKAIPKAKVDRNGQEIIEVGAHRKGIVEELEKAHIYIEQLHKQISEMEKRNKKMEERLVKLETILNKQ